MSAFCGVHYGHYLCCVIIGADYVVQRRRFVQWVSAQSSYVFISVSWLIRLGCQYQCKWSSGKTRLRNDIASARGVESKAPSVKRPLPCQMPRIYWFTRSVAALKFYTYCVKGFWLINTISALLLPLSVCLTGRGVCRPEGAFDIEGFWLRDGGRGQMTGGVRPRGIKLTCIHTKHDVSGFTRSRTYRVSAGHVTQAT